MSARSAQRTRWRRWRMGRDIAGRKDRDGRMSGCQAQIVSGDSVCALVPLLLLLCWQQDKPLPGRGLLMKQISLFTSNTCTAVII